ncbi:S-adenosyl-L-methionine:benzoic acid/salicylic acid carboxyl methyltransferase 3-like [Typha angustifolia]|uniref:S-adenosyl-L-methionine:benzoic acid/salicylic acid carboxyl methyltransferase 3-like n=1 Tax=Typha angustifolia TaxID=59011 RepID=UPI003C2BF68A
MTLKVDEVLSMVGGTGENSYAVNNKIEETKFERPKSIVKQNVLELYSLLHPKNFVTADLGCSSGINAFMLFSEIMDGINESCDKLSLSPPEIHLFLNDLQGNDFNTVFRSLNAHKEKLMKEKGEKFLPFYPVGVPGSFFTRLFPKNTVHFMYSTLSVHWLSEVPRGLVSEDGVALNPGNIYISKTSPPIVPKLYFEQYKRDFTMFLKHRSDEMCSGGRMVLTYVGRSVPDHSETVGNTYIWSLISRALNEMVAKGAIKAKDVDTFNMPLYKPSMEEVKLVTEMEGSFDIVETQIMEPFWDLSTKIEDRVKNDNIKTGTVIAKEMRAVAESLLASHFGEAIMDDLFSRLAEIIADHISKEKGKHVLFTVAFQKRG